MPPPSGYEIVPRPEARALAAYVTSLHQDGYLFEAPPPPQPAGKTNAPVKVPTKSLSVNRHGFRYEQVLLAGDVGSNGNIR